MKQNHNLLRKRGMADAEDSQANKELFVWKIIRLPMRFHPRSLADAKGYDSNLRFT